MAFRAPVFRVFWSCAACTRTEVLGEDLRTSGLGGWEVFEWCSAGKQSWSTADCRAAAKHYNSSFPLAPSVVQVRNAEPPPLPLPGFPGLAAACP